MVKSNQLSTLIKQWLNKLSPLLLLLSVVWLCWSLSKITWLIISPPHSPVLQNLARQDQVKPLNSSMNSFTIFHNPSLNTINTEQNLSGRQPSNISIKGVMQASPMSDSSAMIEVSGKMKNYRVGTKIDGTGYTLSWVDWDKIIIEDSQGQEFTITLNEPMELNQEFMTKNGSSRQKNRRTSAPKPLSKSPNTYNPSNSNQDNRAMRVEANPMDTVVDELTKNPSAYLSKIGVMATGKGYDVTDAMPAGLRSKIGLQSGDKVLSVNGQSVGANPASDAQLLKKVQKSGQAQIQVQRGSQVITIRQQINK